jgi:hypothetical protein
LDVREVSPFLLARGLRDSFYFWTIAERALNERFLIGLEE